MADNSKLTQQQELFAQNIAKGMNDTDAYKAAGYKAKNDQTAQACGSRLRLRPKIQARLRELADEARAPNIMDRQQIQSRLTEYALRKEQPDEVVPTVAESIKAMEMLSRLQGLFIDKQQVELSGALPVMIRNDVHE